MSEIPENEHRLMKDEMSMKMALQKICRLIEEMGDNVACIEHWRVVHDIAFEAILRPMRFDDKDAR